jgi:hypothetical protein
LARNAKIIKGDLGGAQEGGENTRRAFFPDCTNSANDYVFFYGTEAQVQTAIKNLSFDITNLQTPTPDVLYNTDQVKKDDLNNNGLLASETPLSALDNNADPDCPNGKDAYVFTPATTTLKGQLFYIKNGAEESKFDEYNQVSVGAYDNDTLVKAGTLTAGGVYTIDDIPVNKDSSYPLVIKVEDQANIFDDEQFDTVIPATAGAETSTGKTQLVTASGVVCDATDSQCISQQTPAKGQVNVTVTNAETGAPVSGLDVQLRQGLSLTGSTVQTVATNDDGVAEFKDVEYGNYSAFVGDSSYQPANAKIALQSATVQGGMSVTPAESENDITLSMSLDSDEADMDFKMYAQNPSGYECEVSPLNKYCAYAQHMNDSTPTNKGSEIINIRDLAVAKYRTTVEPAPDYQDSCTQATQANINYHAGWSWLNFLKGNKLTDLPFKFGRKFGTRKVAAAATTNTGAASPAPRNPIVAAILALVSFESPVETPFQAKQPKIVVNKGGNALDKPEVITTFIEPNEDEVFENDPEDPFDETVAQEGEEPVATEDLIIVSSSGNAGLNQENPEESAEEVVQSEVISTAEVPEGTGNSPQERILSSTQPSTTAQPSSTSTAQPSTTAQPSSTSTAQPSTTAQPSSTGQPAASNGTTTTAATPASPQFLIVDCFTGFGKVSSVAVQKYLATKTALKDWTFCDNRINADYTLAKLKAANDSA